MKKRVIIFVLMILAVFLSVSAVSAMDVNTVDSNSTVLTAADDSLSVGESNSNVSFSSSNVIEENNNNVIGDNNQQKAVNLDAPSIELYYKNGTRFMINLTDENGNGLANQTVSILINGVTYNKITDENGSTSIGINLYSGLYHVTVSYKGTTEYAPASTTSEVKVMPTINSGDVTKFYKNGTQYYATFLDGHGNPLINTTVRFNINGVFYNRVTNDKGVAKLNIQLRPANYVLTAYNPNNGYQCGYTIKVLPTVLAEDLNKLYLDKNQFYATFLQGDGTPLVNTNITFNINGVFYNRVTNDEGVAKLNIRLSSGKYILTAYHPLDGYDIGYTVTVVDSVSTIIKTQHYDFIAGVDNVVSIVLYDQFNHTVSNQTVSLKVGSVTYTGTTDDNGVAKYNIKLLTPGNYTATYNFNKNGGYLASAASNTISVYEGKDVVLIPGDDIVLKGEAFSVLVKDEDGNLVINKNVYFNVNGVNYVRVTDKNGVASINIRLDAGVYNISYTFNATGYKKVTGSTIMYVITTTTTIIQGNDVTIGKDANQKFNVTLTASGVPIVNKNVTIRINGVDYIRTTDNNGVASLTIRLDAGTYLVTYSFNGDSKLAPSSGNAYCTVVDRKGSLFTVNGGTVFTQNSTDKFKVSLKNSDGSPIANEKVIFTINGVDYTRTTDANGIASLSIQLGIVGTYEISYKFAGNNENLGCEGSSSIVITKYINNGNGYWVQGANMYNVDLVGLAASGTGNIFLNFYAFTKYGESSVLSWIKQANSHGIKVHIWMQVFYDGGWLSPLNSDGSINTALFNERIAEAKKYAALPGVAGVHFDYLRYPGTAYKHPGGTAAISEFVKLATTAIRGVNPNCLISAAVMPEKNDAYVYGQDIAVISKYLDIIVPMVYKGNYNSGTSWISSITQWFVETSNGAAVWVGLQTYVSDNDITKLPISELSKDAQTAYDAGAKGVMMFRWGLSNFIDFNKLNTHEITPSYGDSVSINSILAASASLKKYIEDKGVLPKFVTVGNFNYTVPQFLYLMTKATEGIANGNLKEITAILVNASSKTSGDVINKQLVKSEFVSLAKTLSSYMSANGIAPGNVSSTLGDIKYESLIYAYARVLSYYQSNSALPNFVFVTNLLDNYSLTVTMKVSAGGTSYKPNVLYTTVWLNYCPNCGYYGTLLVNPKGTAEGELTCTYCDCDYCGVSGKEKLSSSTRVLTRLTESIPESSGEVGDNISIDTILAAAKVLKAHIQANNALPDYVIVNDEQYTLSQFLYLMSKAIGNINDGNLGNITVVGASSPGTPNGDKISTNINKTEYLDVASRVSQYIISNGQAPNYASSSAGKISYADLLDAFSRILAYYADNSKTLPNFVLINNTGGSGASALVADKAKELVNGINSTRDKADALFKFVRDKISYSSYFNTIYGAEGTLIKGYGNCCDQAQLLVAMARSVGLTARFATGKCVFTSGLDVGHVWVQFYIGGKWVVADPTSTRNSLGVIKNWNTNSYINKGTYDVLPY